ncbi:beta-lactamase superfamily domain-containing protein [Podospora australis]|uniref:Beta-lactamase superfamily domain-containing protein n=1 Tax=Podospora australis TaxID=1536484 RepID=A0AAN6WYR3_9PEZI|nr:beta-lactamase superfamily domain-containing protein [Podospora australis]
MAPDSTVGKILAIAPISKPKSASNTPPEHHVLSTSTARKSSGWSSYLPSWSPSPGKTRPSLQPEGSIAGFRNPWPSWHKPTKTEVFNSLEWGADTDPCINLAATHLCEFPEPSPASKRPNFSDLEVVDSPGAKAARLLQIQKPDFLFPSSVKTKATATWIGHAGALVQLPPLTEGNRPLRFLFDPVFGMRCFPSEYFGPIRSYPPPCDVQDLPEIDAVFISHNHYDHMDGETLKGVWMKNKEIVRFFVPLGNKSTLVSWGLPEDRVFEMDWWDSTFVSSEGDSKIGVKIWCTPAQHNSARNPVDGNYTLWSSWYLEQTRSPEKASFKVFFGGDTGYQFHSSNAWPPSPPNGQDSENKENPYPPCPAFAEIRRRIGAPDLLILPISVGASFAYLRSFFPFPDWGNPMPRHSEGVVGANHMPPWDAVKVLLDMAGENKKAVAIGMHWGTFVTDPVEVLKTLGQLEWACQSQGVKFARELSDDDRKSHSVFLALNHGQTVTL